MSNVSKKVTNGTFKIRSNEEHHLSRIENIKSKLNLEESISEMNSLRESGLIQEKFSDNLGEKKTLSPEFVGNADLSSFYETNEVTAFVTFQDGIRPNLSNSKRFDESSFPLLKRFNEILENYDVQRIISHYDNLYGETKVEGFDPEEDYSKLRNSLNGIYIPHPKTVFSVRLTVKDDLKEFISRVRNLNFVLMANVSHIPKAQTTGLSTGNVIYTPFRYSFDPANDWSNSSYAPTEAALSGPPSYDNSTNNYPVRYYHFNRHKAFQGIDYFYEHPLNPQMEDIKIVVVDENFDVGSQSNCDSPDYDMSEARYIYKDSNGVYQVGIASVYPLNDTSTSITSAHGASVSNIIAASKNSSGGIICPGNNLHGFAPGAEIIPIGIQKPYDINSGTYEYETEGLVKALEYLHQRISTSSVFKVDAINISMGASSNILTHEPSIRAQIYKLAVLDKVPVIIPAGNTDNFLNTSPPACSSFPACLDVGQIVVGGIGQTDGKRWGKGSTVNADSGSSFETSNSSYIWSGYGIINLAASAQYISHTTYTPNSPYSSVVTDILSGTSYSAPMVTATIGMMRKIMEKNHYSFEDVDPLMLRSLITAASDIDASEIDSCSVSPNNEITFMGQWLNWEPKNKYRCSGMRTLNVYNSLLMADELSKAMGSVVGKADILRIHNIDDAVIVMDADNPPTCYQQNCPGIVAVSLYQDEKFVVWNDNLHSGTRLQFRSENYEGRLSYAYQFLRNGYIAFEEWHGSGTTTDARNIFDPDYPPPITIPSSIGNYYYQTIGDDPAQTSPTWSQMIFTVP